MKISVVIPTINRYDDLLNTVNYLVKQKFDSFEIIIIDQTDNVNESIIAQFKSYANVHYVQSEHKSASAARNIGIKMSKAEIILFLDDDVIIDDQHFLHKHYRHYYDSDVPGVFGCPIEYSSNRKLVYKRHWMSYRSSEVDWLYFPSNYGCNTTIAVGRSNNLSVRRAIAIAVGGMDENYEKGAHREEGDFCLRVSRKYGNFLFDPQARLIHIGNAKGGIRSWNDSDYIKAKHNIIVAIYFDLKMSPIRYRHEYFFATLRYFILNKTILSRPRLYFSVIKRVIASFFKAYKLYKAEPKYLS